MKRALRQAAADVRTGLREPYFWLCWAAIGLGLGIVAKSLAIGDRHFAGWALLPLALAWATLEVDRRTRSGSE